jgi:hypothetical protein
MGSNFRLGSYRLWGAGFFIVDRLDTYTEIARFDNKIDKGKYPQYAQDKHVYHFHIGGIDAIHFVVGVD